MTIPVIGRVAQTLSFGKTLSSRLFQHPCPSSFLRRSRGIHGIKDSHGGSSILRVSSFCSVASPNKGNDDDVGNLHSNSFPSYPLLMVPPQSVLSSDDSSMETSSESKNIITDKRFLYFLDPTNEKILKIEKLPNWNLHSWKDDEEADSICVGSSHGWLTFIHLRTAAISLVNPFLVPPKTSLNLDSHHDHHAIQLPPVEMLPLISSVIYKKEGGGSSNNITVERFSIEDTTFPIAAKKLLVDKKFIKKVVLSANPLIVNPQGGDVVYNDECIVVVIYGMKTYGSVRNNLAFCRLGDTLWTEVDGRCYIHYNDVAYSKKDKLFYALSSSDEIEAWNLHNSQPKSHAIEHSKPEFQRYEFKIEPLIKFEMDKKDYLVDCNGDLLVVRRFYGSKYQKDNSHTTFGFQVLKWVSCKKEWEKVEDVGDTVLFVGDNHAVSLSATEFPQMRRNSIYFTDLDVDTCGLWPFHDMGVYDLFSGAVKTINLPMVKGQNPIWVIPGLL